MVGLVGGRAGRRAGRQVVCPLTDLEVENGDCLLSVYPNCEHTSTGEPPPPC